MTLGQEIFKYFKLDVTELVGHKLVDRGPLKNWHQEVAVWYNNFLKLSAVKQFTKRPQLYLYGESNAGKTQFVKWLFREHFERNQVFRYMLYFNSTKLSI
jgi:hypothetical protein